MGVARSGKLEGRTSRERSTTGHAGSRASERLEDAMASSRELRRREAQQEGTRALELREMDDRRWGRARQERWRE